MLDVYFESDKEVICFCENLFSYNKQIELNWKTHKEWGNHLQFKAHSLTNETIKAMADSMVDVFRTHRLASLIKKIVKENYYYTNVDEIERILELTLLILKEEFENHFHIKNEKVNPNHLLWEMFFSNVKSATTIHYDSVVKFRLKVFKNVLLDYVGIAIDEFKQEEDHQDFIEMLRKYISKKKAVYEEIHVLQGSDFSFYKSSGKRFSRLELRTLMHEEPLYIVGLEVEELNLAPLVAIAPEKIKIYGDNPSEPKTSTVFNVFQERVIFEPFHHFPFPHLGSY